MNHSNLYLKDRYLNKNIDYLVNRYIIEYDIRSAGFNISKEFKLLSDYELQKLGELPKEIRNVKIGLIQRSRPEFRENLKKSFIETRRLFFESNNLQDDSILSIKKDAIFVLEDCHKTNFGHIKFLEKNVYTSFYHINKVEFFYNSNTDILHVKNINDVTVSKHDGYMNDFFKTLFKYKEKCSREEVIELLKDFIYEYKTMQLPLGFYREYNDLSYFRTNEMVSDKCVLIEDLSEGEMNLDIRYNYINFLIPLVRMLY